MESLPTIVTAADTRYWRSLHQFLLSVERKGLATSHRFIVYDLGLAPLVLRRLEQRFAWCEFRRFRFEDYPRHLAMEFRCFAWKPVIISEVCAAADGPVLWLDSATVIQAGNLNPVWSATRKGGVYALKGQTALEERCDPLTLAALDVPFAFRRRPELAAGVLGFDPGAGKVRALIEEWRTQALTERLITPRTPPLDYHRFDQSLLTILLYRYEAEGAIRLPDGEIDIGSRAPIRWMTSRNKASPGIPVWADPFVRLYYWLYKTVDQALYKLGHLHDTRINGLHRLLKEHFSVMLMRDGKAVHVPAPPLSYYADPFLVSHDGSLWLLVEKFDYRQCKGELAAVALDGELRGGPPIPILPRGNHASFPYPFMHDGILHLVPETSADGAVEIHASVEFPARWRLVSRPLENVDAADTVIFRHRDLWWLFTSIRGNTNDCRFLAVYFTDNVLEGKWHPHPINESRLYENCPFGFGRNGGAIFSHDGKLLRPMQASLGFYGEAMQLMEIEILTLTEFRERPFDGACPANDIIGNFSPHHLAMADGVTAFDVRDRARSPNALWPMKLKRRPFVSMPI